MLKFLLLLLLTSVPLYANPRFHDATQEAGIDFVHVNGANGQKFVIETVGPGGGFFDSDGDGRLDIYLINGAAVPGTDYDPAPQNALYRNQRRRHLCRCNRARWRRRHGLRHGVRGRRYRKRR